MRGRSRMKNLKILQEFFKAPVLASILMLLLCSSFVIGEPGYLDFDNLPETKFSCAGKVIGGYYADLETSCQMFHVCTLGQLDEPMDIKFLCLNGTVFDQETRVCERVDEVDCSKSEKFYYLNLELYGNTMVPIPDEETSEAPAIITSTTPTTSSTTTTTTTRPVTPFTIPTTTTTNIINLGTTTIAPQSQQQATTQVLSQDEKPTRSTFTTFNTTNSNGQNVMGFASSTVHPSHHLSHSHQQHHQYTPSSTHKPIMQTSNSGNGNTNNNQQQLTDDEEYEYDDEEDDSIIDDDYLAEQNRNHDESGAHNLHQPQQQQLKFSPQHFIYQQQQPTIINKNVNNNNHNNNYNKYKLNNGGGGNDGNKNLAISFQQQQYQNGDLLSVSVTSHSTGSGNTDSNKLNQNAQQFSGYHYNSQVGSKRIPLLPPPAQQQFEPPSGHPGLQPLPPPFRLRGQGFKLPQQYQPQPFDGYRRTSPQIPLHLPFEQNRNQKDLLGFEDNSADDLIAIQKERKDLKRSDTLISQSPQNLPATTTTETTTSIVETTINSNENKNTQQRQLSSNSNIKNINNYRDIKKIDNFQNRNSSSSSRSSSSSSSININNNYNNSHNSNLSSMNNSNNSINNNNNNNYDKVLLTPQNRYIPTLPKVIITASASVSDASGKKLNYSLGNVLGKTIKIAPSTYDEYKEDDVALDPFFLDVPKIRPRIKRRK